MRAEKTIVEIPKEIVIPMSEVAELKKELKEIRESLQRMAIAAVENIEGVKHNIETIERVFKAIAQLESRVRLIEIENTEIQNKLARSEWMHKLFYGVVSAVFIGAIVAAVSVVQ